MTGGRNLSFEGPKTWPSGPERPEKDRFGQDPSSTRGYIKLSDAARAFGFDFRGKVVLDIGSSTGGFTQYALDHGATKVIAVEKGTNQMAKPLRFDPRVELYEKTDIFDVVIGTQIVCSEGVRSAAARDVAPAARGRSPLGTRIAEDVSSEANGPAGRAPKNKAICVPGVIVADVSFISLKKVLPHAKKNLAGSHTEFLVMLKPQFEAKPDQLVNGVVKNEKIRREIIKGFELWLKQNNFLILNKRDNDLKGKTGNKERFYHLRLAK